MEFIKRNYEKIILGAVLLGLVGVLAFMPVVIISDQQRMKDLRDSYIPRKVEPLPPLDLSRQSAVLDRLKSPYDLDFSTTNRLFNPMQWQRNIKDNTVRKTTGHEVIDAVVITKITPLYYIISLDSVATNALGTPPRYTFNVEHQAAALPAQRRSYHLYASVKEKVRDFTFIGIKGPPENPDQLTLKLADTGAEVTLSKDKPFQRVDGYTTDLKYDPEKLTDKLNVAGQRAGASLKFSGDDYIIIAIDQNEVILLAQSNQKKYILRYAP